MFGIPAWVRNLCGPRLHGGMALRLTDVPSRDFEKAGKESDQLEVLRVVAAFYFEFF